MKTNDEKLRRDTGVPPVRATWKIERSRFAESWHNRHGRDARVTLIVLGLVLAVAGNRRASAAEWQNTLKPRGTPAAPITLVSDGKPLDVVMPANATGPERKAAEDLRHWMKEMTGAEARIVPPDPAALVRGTIRIETRADLAPDGYEIAAKDGFLVLRGGPGRGVVNAVYALLEEDLGCRFYTNESIRLPAKSKTLIVAPVPRTVAPRLRLRDPFYFASFDPVWSLRNRTSAPDAHVPEEHGGRMDYGGLFVHTHAGLLPPGKYFKDHPEYFAQNGAGQRYADQLCPTHPDVARIVTENVLKALKDNPNAEIVSVSKNDNGGDQICHCERCAKLRADEGGTDMANQLFLVNQVAEQVEKQYPYVFVDTLAYLETIRVPKTIRPRKNVVIRVCNDVVGAWSRPFTPARELPVAAIVKEWSAAHDKLSIWDYNVNFSHFLAPMPNMSVIADNIRFWVDNNAIGLLTQGGYQSTSERDELRSWVIAKLMWDPSLDQQALVDDFIAGHYGKAAPMIAQYDALLVKAGQDHAAALANPPGGIRYPMDVPFLSREFLDKSSEIFDRAKQAAAGDPGAPGLLRRVERAELPVMYVKLARGPGLVGNEFGALLERFEKVAKREKVDWLFESNLRLEAQLNEWKKQVPAAAAEPAAREAAKPQVTEPKNISQGKEAYSYQAFPDATRLKNGDILAVFYAGYGHVSLEADDFPNGGRICMVRSSDEGKTWTEPQVLYDDADDNRDGHIAQLDDGSLVCTFFSWRHTGPRYKSHKDFDSKTWLKSATNTGAQMVRSTDGGKTWETAARTIFADWYCSAPVRQLADGTCVLGLYQEDERTKRNVPGTTRSSDRGMTWEQPVTIEPPPGVSLAAETDVIPLRDGRLFAALRGDKFNMHYATSSDNAKSWSPAIDIGFKGHCPHLTRLSTGEILLTHRVPQTELHVSRDDAKTWQGPYELDHVIGAYPATVELKDGTVLAVYYTEGKDSHVRAMRLRLTKDGIEKLPL